MVSALVLLVALATAAVSAQHAPAGVAIVPGQPQDYAGKLAGLSTDASARGSADSLVAVPAGGSYPAWSAGLSPAEAASRGINPAVAPWASSAPGYTAFAPVPAITGSVASLAFPAAGRIQSDAGFGSWTPAVAAAASTGPAVASAPWTVSIHPGHPLAARLLADALIPENAAPWAPLSAAPYIYQVVAPSEFLADAAGWALIPSPAGAASDSPAARAAAIGVSHALHSGHPALSPARLQADAPIWAISPSPVGTVATTPVSRASGPISPAALALHPGQPALPAARFQADAPMWTFAPSSFAAPSASPIAKTASPAASPWGSFFAASAAPAFYPGHPAFAPSIQADAPGIAFASSPVDGSAAAAASRAATIPVAPSVSPWASALPPPPLNSASPYSIVA